MKHVRSRLDRPWAKGNDDGTVSILDGEDEVFVLTLAAAEDLAAQMETASNLGREDVRVGRK